MPRPIYLIAAEIRKHWQTTPAHADAYLRPMEFLSTINDSYGCDSAKSIVLYFLANAQTWRGPIARSIKAELKQLAGVRK